LCYLHIHNIVTILHSSLMTSLVERDFCILLIYILCTGFPLLLTRRDIYTVAAGICKGENPKVGVRFGNLFEPFVAGSAWSERIQVLVQVCKVSKRSVSEKPRVQKAISD
jgi:hypothetical protein